MKAAHPRSTRKQPFTQVGGLGVPGAVIASAPVCARRPASCTTATPRACESPGPYPAGADVRGGVRGQFSRRFRRGSLASLHGQGPGRILRRERDPFGGGPGAPILSDMALSYAECRTVQSREAGGHRLFIAQVDGGVVHTRDPLLCCKGEYSTWPRLAVAGV
ncbi:flavin reductase [Streptomyces sp. NPDC001056]